MRWFSFFLCFLSCNAAKYTVNITRVNRWIPLFSHNSIFSYNFNPAFVPSGNSFKEQGLIVRCQQNLSDPTNIYAAGPSALVYTKMQPWDSYDNINFAQIQQSSIIMSNETELTKCGSEDPRIVYRPSQDLYYMTFTSYDCSVPRLTLATAQIPSDPQSWKNFGAVFGNTNPDPSKSAAILFRDDYPGSLHYMYWGDSSLRVATSTDGISWEDVSSPDPWLDTRAGFFDSALVEASAMPLRLSDGNYLMLYNSAEYGFPSDKPGWQLKYNVGFLVLDYDDPLKILYRSPVPIFSPELMWELEGFTPNVVFAEGWEQIGKDLFLVFYGGSDQEVGVAVLNVTITN